MGQILDSVEREFSQRMVGIEEFCTSEEFCGKTLYPRQIVLLKLIFLEEMTEWEESVLQEWIDGEGGCQMCPQIRERRQWLRDNGYSHFSEVNFIGGRRSSKGFISALAAAKIMYETWKLGDPGTHYGIDPDKEIFFIAVAASLEQAKQQQFSDLVSSATRCKALDNVKLLEESFTIPTAADQQYVLEMKNRGIKVGRDFNKLRCKPLAANADTIRGSATLVYIFDEMAFMMEGESRSSAAQCYDAAMPSVAQFGKDSLVFCQSSPYTKIGKFYDRAGDDAFKLDIETGLPSFPNMFSFRFPSWELYRDYARNPKIKEAIMVSPDVDMESLNAGDKIKCQEMRFAEEANPEKFKVERRAMWAEVIDAYLNPTKVDKAFSSEFQGRRIEMQTSGTYEYQYKGHADPSTTTAGFGMALGHVEYFPTGNAGIMEPHVIFDVVQRWNPKDFAESTIDQLEVMDEIAHWIQLFRPYEFTFDQFNSAAMIQFLRTNLSNKGIGGVRVGEVTATKAKNWDRWEVFKTCLNLELIHVPKNCPDSAYAAMELKFLQEKGGRIEKQDLGPVQTKDIADSMAEVVYSLMSGAIGSPIQSLGGLSPRMGGQGGYNIGKGSRDELGAGTASNNITDYLSRTRMGGMQRGGGPNPARGRGQRRR